MAHHILSEPITGGWSIHFSHLLTRDMDINVRKSIT